MRLVSVRRLVVAAIIAGIGLRVWVLASPLGALDADEGVWGLMARHARHGELPVFFWGQNYGGTQETLLTAPVFALAGAGAITVRLIPIVLFTLAALLVWRVGRRTVGEEGARLGAALFWIWPAYLVWKSTRAHGFYGAALVLGLAIMLLALRLRERDSAADAAALGLAVGLGWWATPQIAFVALPALAWLLWRRPAVARYAWLAAAGVLVGASPWLGWNVTHGWESLDTPFGRGGDTYIDHLQTFFYATLPAALGLRVPFTVDWISGLVVGRLLEVAALAGVAVLLVRRRRRRELLLVIGFSYPLVQSLSSFSSLNDEPRYLVLLAPVLALLLGELLARRPLLAGAGAAAAFAASAAGLASMRSEPLPVPPVGGERGPADLDPALRALERAGATRVLAHYSIAYRISFESGERILAGSTGQVRDRHADRVVRGSPHPAYVFIARSPAELALADDFGRRGYHRIVAGEWAVYVHRDSG